MDSWVHIGRGVDPQIKGPRAADRFIINKAIAAACGYAERRSDVTVGFFQGIN
jgi:hypothetical protein